MAPRRFGFQFPDVQRKSDPPLPTAAPPQTSLLQGPPRERQDLFVSLHRGWINYTIDFSFFTKIKDHKLTLEFSINGEPRSVSVKSSRDLNSGEWQQVWIDYNEYHVRFTVNQESILVDLNDGEEFGPFEATLFIGGAPEFVSNP